MARHPRGRFRGAQLIGLINDRSCQRPQAIIRDSCSFLPALLHTHVSAFRKEHCTLDAELWTGRISCVRLSDVAQTILSNETGMRRKAKN